MYGAPSGHPPLAWSWVDERLAAAPTYWVTARTSGPPHPRPVWGVWLGGRLHLSIGTPTTRRALADDPVVTVHLDSGTEVVIVEGRAATGADPAAVAAYDAKYDWSYDVDELGALTAVTPTTVVAWTTDGWAGRGSFRETGRWIA